MPVRRCSPASCFGRSPGPEVEKGNAMTQFEYVAVATALLYSIGVGQLLTKMPHVARRGRRAGLTVLWAVYLLMYCSVTWWLLWRALEVQWNSLRFLWALLLPFLIIVRASILFGPAPDQVQDFERYFYENRLKFHGVGIVGASAAFLVPWVYGAFPWFTLSPVQPGAMVSILFSTLAFATPNAKVQWLVPSVLIGLMLFLLGLG